MRGGTADKTNRTVSQQEICPGRMPASKTGVDCGPVFTVVWTVNTVLQLTNRSCGIGPVVGNTTVNVTAGCCGNMA